MRVPDEGTYECPHCGEEIVVPIDSDTTSELEYVEDCPVCCSPIVLHVRIEEGGDVTIHASAE